MPESGDGASGNGHGTARARPSPHLRREVDLLDDVGSGTASAEPHDPARPRVLVASTSAELTRYVCQGLGRLDPPVAGFTEGRVERFMDRVREILPVLVVLDADFGGGDGFQLCKRLKGSKVGDRLPVLLMVDGARRHEAGRRMAPAGADALLWKPFNLSQLVSEATRLLDREPPPRPTYTSLPKE